MSESDIAFLSRRSAQSSMSSLPAISCQPDQGEWVSSNFYDRITVQPAPDPARAHDAALVTPDGPIPGVWGRSGLIDETQKSEGDGATPMGAYRILKLFYRADRIALPDLPQFDVEAISPGMGWQDDPASARYNSFVPAGLAADHPERFMRNDARYDVIAVLDHNGAWPHATPNPNPAVPGKGSAIFIHVWGLKDGAPGPTAGCVAMERDALIALLQRCDSQTRFMFGG